MLPWTATFSTFFKSRMINGSFYPYTRVNHLPKDNISLSFASNCTEARAFDLLYRSAIYNKKYPTSSPEFMQRNPLSMRQACTARITTSNLSLSLHKRRRFLTFSSAIFVLTWTLPRLLSVVTCTVRQPRKARDMPGFTCRFASLSFS